MRKVYKTPCFVIGGQAQRRKAVFFLQRERRLGECIRAQKETVGLNRGLAGSRISGSDKEPVKDVRPTLADAGIDKKLSSRAQKRRLLSWAIDGHRRKSAGASCSATVIKPAAAFMTMRASLMRQARTMSALKPRREVSVVMALIRLVNRVEKVR